MIALKGQKPNESSAGLLGRASVCEMCVPCGRIKWREILASLKASVNRFPVLDGQVRQARGPLFEFVLGSLTQLQPMGVDSGLTA